MGAWLSDPETFELGTDGPRTVVVGVDDSPAALRALAYAAGLARRNGSMLVAVHVRGSASGGFGAAAGFDASGLVARSAHEVQESVEALLRAEVAQLSEAWGVRIELTIRDGDRLKEVAAVADEHHADAVIVGASNRFSSRIAGSLAVRLVRHRSWPVTVVP